MVIAAMHVICGTSAEKSDKLFASNVSFLFFGPSEQLFGSLVVPILKVNFIHFLLKLRTFFVKEGNIGGSLLERIPQVILRVFIICALGERYTLHIKVSHRA